VPRPSCATSCHTWPSTAGQLPSVLTLPVDQPYQPDDTSTTCTPAHSFSQPSSIGAATGIILMCDFTLGQSDASSEKCAMTSAHVIALHSFGMALKRRSENLVMFINILQLSTDFRCPLTLALLSQTLAPPRTRTTRCTSQETYTGRKTGRAQGYPPTLSRYYWVNALVHSVHLDRGGHLDSHDHHHLLGALHDRGQEPCAP
jgi:hypothetical protein